MRDHVRAGISSVRFAVMPGLSYEARMTRYKQAERHFVEAAELAAAPPAEDAPNAPLVPLPSPADAKALQTKLEWQMLAARTLRARAESQPPGPDEQPLLELSLFESKQHQLRLCVELLWQADDVSKGAVGWVKGRARAVEGQGCPRISTGGSKGRGKREGRRKEMRLIEGERERDGYWEQLIWETETEGRRDGERRTGISLIERTKRSSSSSWGTKELCAGMASLRLLLSVIRYHLRC